MINSFNTREINLNKGLKCPDHQNKLTLGPFSSDFQLTLACLYRHSRLW